MKLLCRKCGKKEAELMSKAEMKQQEKHFMKINTNIINTLLKIADDWTSQSYIVCKSCGHYEKQ